MSDEIYDRDPLDVAAYETVHGYTNPLTGKKGALGLAPVIKMPASTLQNKANPNEEFANFTIKESRQLMLTTGNKAILHTLARELGEACYEVPVFEFVADMDLMNAWMEWQEELANTVKKMKEVLSDKKITKAEVRELELEFVGDIEKGRKLLAEFEAMAEPDDKVTPISKAKS